MQFRWISLAVLVSYLSSNSALKCMTCEWSQGIDECDASGYLKDCLFNQQSCETTVRRYEDHVLVKKNCKDQGACQSNQSQNFRYAGRSTQCSSDQQNSICTCCCSTDKCNVGPLTCTPSVQAAEYTAQDCPAVQTNLPHGNIECNNSNRSGSVCEYQCTEKDYSVWPKGRANNICLGNGSWTHKIPCCARPCPPYYLLDTAMVVHFAGENAENLLHVTLTDGAIFGVIADDAFKISALYYNENPIESSLIKFNDYGENATRLLELMLKRIKISNKGPVNTGKAMLYALEHMLTPEAGMRDSRVPATLDIYLNTNPDDDVKGPADEARRRGILVYVFGFETGDFKFDRQMLLDMAGEENHIFVYDKDFSHITQSQMDDLNNQFCRNPCDHVLHDHE